jgi:hypothetical protein
MNDTNSQIVADTSLDANLWASLPLPQASNAQERNVGIGGQPAASPRWQPALHGSALSGQSCSRSPSSP